MPHEGALLDPHDEPGINPLHGRVVLGSWLLRGHRRRRSLGRLGHELQGLPLEQHGQLVRTVPTLVIVRPVAIAGATHMMDEPRLRLALHFPLPIVEAKELPMFDQLQGFRQAAVRSARHLLQG